MKKKSRVAIEGKDLKFHAFWLEPATSGHKDGHRPYPACPSRSSYASP